MITSREVLAEIMGSAAAIQVYDEVAIVKTNDSWVAVVKEDDNIFRLKHKVGHINQDIAVYWVEVVDGRINKFPLWKTL